MTIDTSGNIPQARRLLDEAKSCDSSADDGRIEAMMVYHEQGAEAALTFVKDRAGEDMKDLRAALLLETAKVDEMLQLLSDIDAGTNGK
jgi:hypothetical protein